MLLLFDAAQGFQGVEHQRGGGAQQIGGFAGDDAAARRRASETGAPALAIQLGDGQIITGKTSDLMGPSAAAVLNAAKALGGIEKKAHLISPSVIEPIQTLKCDYLGNHNPRLHSDEILLALSICAATDPAAANVMSQLKKLAGCEAHSTVILSPVDENIFRRLKINLTCDPHYQTQKLYHPSAQLFRQILPFSPQKPPLFRKK